jgi:3-hydroxyisobutyrate dehydrogenase-like beta-hydroxyacid dehydrogenase
MVECAQGGITLAKLGFIGTGTMGNPIAVRLLDAGHELVVCDASSAATANLEARGARRVGTPREVAHQCAVVFSSLPGPLQVRAVVEGGDGILAAKRTGLVHVDLSTSSFEAVQQLCAIEAAAGATLVDAPVSGGAHGAAQGTLAVMASGERAAFDSVRPLFDAFASNVFYLGESGRGTIAKLVNNLIFLAGALVVQEGFVLAAKAGLGARELLPIINASSARLYSGMAPLFFARNFEMTLFKLGIAEKDVALALESARELAAPLPLAEAAGETYRRAVADGRADQVFFATLATLERAAGVEVEKLG